MKRRCSPIYHNVKAVVHSMAHVCPCVLMPCKCKLCNICVCTVNIRSFHRIPSVFSVWETFNILLSTFRIYLKTGRQLLCSSLPNADQRNQCLAVSCALTNRLKRCLKNRECLPVTVILSAHSMCTNSLNAPSAILQKRCHVGLSR